jgi:hypothetical protein
MHCYFVDPELCYLLTHLPMPVLISDDLPLIDFFHVEILSPRSSQSIASFASQFHAHDYRLTDNFRAGDSIHVGTERPSLEKWFVPLTSSSLQIRAIDYSRLQYVPPSKGEMR